MMLSEYISQLTSNTRLTTAYSLNRVRRLAEYFGNPQESYKTIHIAGTNGKGSVSKMTFAILKEAGYRVGVFTSPYLMDIVESIETNDGYISHDKLAQYFDQILAIEPKTTFFEAKTIAAFLYFRDTNCEYGVIEVGLGGRLDATNILTHPSVTCITSIGWDHMDMLGDTLEAIAGEKAGIIKSGVPLVTDCSFHTIQGRAQLVKAPIISGYQGEVATNLVGEHQINNARLAYQIGLLLKIETENIKKGLLHVTHRGRCEWITPNILVDGAHNLDGITVLAKYIASIRDRFDHIEFIVSLKDGKDPQEMFADIISLGNISILNREHSLITPPKILSEKLGGTTLYNPEEIYNRASTEQNTLFVLCGSLYGIGTFYQ